MKLLLTILVLMFIVACGEVIIRDDQGFESLKERQEAMRRAHEKN